VNFFVEELPMNILETGRLVRRELSIADAAFII